MTMRNYLAAVVVAGALFAIPVQGNGEDRSPLPMASGPNLEVSTTSYCYAGSTVDPATGETLEYYKLCEDNLDMA